MANTWTDYGINRMLDITFRGATGPTACKVQLLSNMTGADADTELVTGVNALASGNGYSPTTVTLDSSGFDVLADSSGDGWQYLQLADISWTASGGSISATGAVLVMTDGGTDYVWAIYDFGGTVTATDGGTLTLQNCELRVGI